jgi:hypothetical protein
MQNVQRHGRGEGGSNVLFRLVFGCCFVMFLPAAVAHRFAPRQASDPERGTVFGEAARAAGTVTPFAFMG